MPAGISVRAAKARVIYKQVVKENHGAAERVETIG